MKNIKVDEDFANGIAVIGMTGRFPGAKTTDDFWRNLRDGVESVSFFTDEELLTAGVDRKLLGSPNYVKANSFIEDADLFDAQFFGYSPREAEVMDPQHRLFLECAWEALETAGYGSDAYEGKVGVYAGLSLNSYLLNNLISNREAVAAAGGFQIVLGNDKDHLPTRVSYKLNLRGPSINVQTSCSTSLVAVHLACQGLMNYECDVALTGGVSVSVPQKTGYVYKEGGVVSGDGHCRAFDAQAQGTVSGDGVGIVVLKRLSDALEDGDTVYAVIKGSAVNNDGSAKVGYTAPSVEGQAAAIAEALALAGVEPETINYIEAHGTGTPLGDPIEITALTKVFRARTPRREFCAIGSVKSNIGHLDAAAGVAGLIKTVLALRHRQVPPSLHFTEPNPGIDFANSPFYVNASLREWTANGSPRRAGVSSFGIGGTNAHVILEEAPEVEESGASPRAAQLLVLSAKTESALEQATQNLAAHLLSHPDAKLADVAYTLGAGRRAFQHRRALVCRDVEDARDALAGVAAGRTVDGRAEGKRPVAFMFSGQGTQYAGMGEELYRTEEVFRAAIDRCSELLRDELGLDLRAVLFPADGGRETADAELKQTRLTQPALFAFEYALAQQWMAWGVQPSAMIGHSIGEYTAACLAGVFTLEEAARVVCARGRLIQQLPEGAMLAVMMDEAQLTGVLEGHGELSLAAVNAEGQCVVSGPSAAVEALEAELLTRGVTGKRLETSHAFHSAMMEPALEEFRRVVESVRLQAPRIRWVSNVTGRWITDEEATDAAYWVKHVRQTVRFGDGLGELLKDNEVALLEVGPGETLSKLARRRERNTGRVVVASLGSKSHAQAESLSEAGALLKACGELWAAGASVNWNEFYSAERRRRIPLPTYPFERERYWVERQAGHGLAREAESSLERRPNVAEWFHLPVWKHSAPPQFLPQAKDETRDARWLLFTDGGEVGARLAEQLAAGGQKVLSVRRGVDGDEFVTLEDGAYRIDARRREHYERLLAELGAAASPLTRIVYLWSLEGATAADESAEAQWASFESLLTLAQVFGGAHTDGDERWEMAVLTDSAHDVTGREEIRPEKALTHGLCADISRNFPALSCRVVDVETDGAATASAVNQLAAELRVENAEPVVAYRRGRRWTRDFEAVNTEAATIVPDLDPGGYLFTDIANDAVYEAAKQIAGATRGAKLYLISRPESPRAGEGDEARGASRQADEQGRSWLRQRMDALEALGAEVVAHSVDVDSAEQLRHHLNRVRGRWGKIGGVIHAVGLDGERSGKEAEAGDAAAELLKAEVRRLTSLDEALADEEPGFVLLLTTTASIFGGAAGAHDAAAGCFAAAQAQGESARGRWTCVALATEPHVDARGEAGRVEASENLVTADDLAEVFTRLRGAVGMPQVVVSPVSVKALVRHERESRAAAREGRGRRAQTGLARHARSEAQGAYVAPRNELESVVAEMWEEMLGIERVGVEDDFFALGGHSLAGIQLIFSLRQKFEVEDLHLNSLFRSPTVAGIAEAIERARRRELLWPHIIVPMQVEGTKPPFFCVHPIGGDVFGLVDLARHMAPDHPFYGIQAEGLNDVANFGDYQTLEEIAASYNEAVKAVAPEGPYLIGGFSYGGIVAFEMAHQLKRQGEDVAMLAMLDTPAPQSVAKVALLDDATLLYSLARERARQHGTELNLTLDEVRAVAPEEQLLFIGEHLKAINVAPSDLNEDWLRNFIKGFRIRLNTTVNYTPEVYPGRITLFRASERDEEMASSLSLVMEDYADPHMGWDKVSGEPIDVQQVVGHHELIVRGAYSPILAEKLKACIDKSLVHAEAV